MTFSDEQYHTQPTSLVAPPEPAKPKRNGWLVAGAIIVTGLLSGSVGGVIGSSVATDNKPSVSVAENTDTQATGNDVSVGQLSGVIQNALKSIVTVSVVTNQGSGTGSGVAVDTEGHIVTNAHVATLSGLTENGVITVQNSEGETASAELVGYDAESDLAVLKTDLPGLKPAVFADSSQLSIGDETIAIGSPLGLSGTVTTGIVSALNRPITLASSEVQQPSLGGQQLAPGQIALNAVQTDAAINSGNSGGGLFNSSGQIIGINVAIASAGENSGSIGVGFAIPANLAKKVVDAILTDGEVRHGYLGVGVDDYRADRNSTFTSGVNIVSVEPGSPAAEAGLVENDVIIAANGEPVTSTVQFIALVRQSEPESSMSLKVSSPSGENRDVQVTFGETTD